MLTIDRFEGNFAVCIDENCKTIKIEKKELPSNAKEGDILEKSENCYIINKEKTQLKFDEIKKLQDSLWE